MILSSGEKIKILLKRKNMTHAELADKLGQSRQNLSNKLNRDNFTENELRKIAEALNCQYESSFVLLDTGERV